MSVPAIDRIGPTETVATPESKQRLRADERAARARDRFHRGTARWVVLAGVSFAAFLMLIPFALMLLNAFKSPVDYSTNGPLSWPTEFYTKGLVTYWNQVNYPEKLWNSTLIAGCVAVLAVLISLFNAYAIGVGRVKGRLWIVALFLLGNMIPQEALVYPLYFFAKEVGLYNTRLAVIIIFTVIQSAFGTYLLASVLGLGLFGLINLISAVTLRRWHASEQETI